MATYYVHIVAVVEANHPDEADAIVNGQVLVNDFNLIQEIYTTHVNDEDGKTVAEYA